MPAKSCCNVVYMHQPHHLCATILNDSTACLQKVQQTVIATTETTCNCKCVLEVHIKELLPTEFQLGVNYTQWLFAVDSSESLTTYALVATSRSIKQFTGGTIHARHLNGTDVVELTATAIVGLRALTCKAATSNILAGSVV